VMRVRRANSSQRFLSRAKLEVTSTTVMAFL